MNTKIMELMVVLDKETACYRTMRNVLDDEQASISLSTKQRFDNVQHEKESVVVELQRLEKKRKRIVEGLCATLCTDARPKTVSQLAQYVKSPQNEQLLACAHRLRSIIGDVQEKNRRNQMLINQHLDLVNGSLKLLSDLIDGSPVYLKPGTHQAANNFHKGGGRFIRGSA